MTPTNPTPTQQGETLDREGAHGHVHRFGIISVPPEYGHSYLRCITCPLSKHLPEHDVATCEICTDVFTAYNQAIEDAKQAIREEHVANPCEAPTYINTIARRCSPHRYVASLPAATSSAHQVRCVHGVPEGLTCAICGPIRNDDPPTLAPARVEGEQDVKQRIESIAEPWICVEEKPCEEAVPVHWDEMITALAAAEQRTAAASADNDESRN